MENSSTKFIRDTILVTLSNVISILSGILIGFALPKILTVDGYGFYKIYALYIGYVSLFRFGFAEGVYLKFAGKSIEEIDKGSMRTWVKFYYIMEAIFTAIGLAIFLLMKADFSLIFIFVFIYVFSNNTTYFFQAFSQSVGRFKELSFLNTLRYVLNIVLIVTMYLVYKIGGNYQNYIIYLLFSTIINFILLIFYMISYRAFIFGKSNPLKDEKANILHLFKIGIPLLAADFVGILITSIDKEIISLAFNTNQYAYYAFAYNLVNLVILAVDAVSTVLFPTLKKMDKEKAKQEYPIFISVVMVLMAFSLLAYFPLYYVVGWILNKYVPSLPYFAIIMPSLIFSSLVSIIVKNYYKTLNMVPKFLILSAISLVVGIGAQIAVYFLTRDISAVAISSVCTYALWYVLVEIPMSKKLENKWFKNLVFAILSAASFIVVTKFTINVLLSLTIYFVDVVILTFALQRKEALFVFDSIKKFFKKNKKNEDDKEKVEN